MDTYHRRDVSNEELHFILASSLDGFLLVDSNGYIFEANSSYCQLVGYSREELLHIHISALDANESAEDVARRSEEIRQKGALRFETKHKHKSGVLVDIEVSANYSPVQGGSFCSIIRDITDRKQAEKALFESENRFRSVMEKIPNIAVQGYRLDGTVIFWNHASELLYGYPAEEALGANLFDLIIPIEMKEGVITAVQQMIDSGEPIPADELLLQRKDGSRVPVFSSHALITPVGRPPELFCLDIDLTERKYAQESLEAMLNALPDLMFRLDSEGVIHEFRSSAVDLLYIPPEVFLNKRIEEVLPEETAQIIMTALGAAAQSGICRDAAYSLPTPQGEIWYEFSIAAMGKTATNFIMLSRDITDRKRAEDKLISAKTAAEAGSIAKSEFLANISHEIRTPMNGVIGNVQLLRFTELTDEQKQYVEFIEADANHLVSVINDVLDISKIEAGKIDLEQTPFSLHNCISDLTRPQESRIHAKGLSLQTDIDSNIPEILTGDPLRLKQVLRNLLGNAVKFTEAGGIQIRIAMLERNDKKVRLCFSIIDTGIGIKPEAVEKIFTPFSQADASMTRRFGGTGLGLSICSRLVGLMGGNIRVESLEGKGSTFHVTLPFFVSEQPLTTHDASKLATTLPVWEGAPLRILLVDDSLTNLAMVANLLRRLGHEVTSCSDGSEALEQWRSNQFDRILMDIQMPVMDGIEATRIIREQEKKSGKHIPIIALTAHALNEQRNHLLVSGFDGYVSKPIDLATLNAEMKRIVQQRTV